MDAERWQRVDGLFAAALELPVEARPGFLAAECGEDTALRDEVLRLLAADGRAGSFLETPAALTSDIPIPFPDEPSGRRLGPYTLIRRLGEGGMGTVYLAHRDDGAYDRDVAIKLLRWGLADGELRHRFLAERRILARMEHPHIARLYDGGSTEDGQPYLVMEYVEGLPLDVHCDSRRLTVEARIRLFQKVCSAVQHAHRNLLVHRDLKPSNVLVTEEGEPKLLDFGIAKQLQIEGDETRTHLRAMTPGYASPEQVRGDPVTTASDVYSLGVLLYELLTGRSPYREAGRSAASGPFALERAILEETPEKPSEVVARGPGEERAAVAVARGCRPRELRRSLRGDLDNIVLTALRKDPGRRYGSAAELEEDLERFLTQRPVRAYRDSWRYRAGLFVRRHRWAVAASAVVALVVLGLVAGIVAQSLRATRERDKARQALAFLVDVFKQSDPYKTGGERVTPRQILATGAARVTRELQDEPEVQASLMDAIGQVYLGLGLPDQAQPLLEKALERRRAADVDPLEEAVSLQSLADLHQMRAEHSQAGVLYEEALTLERGELGDDAPEVAVTLSRLAAVRAEQDPKEAERLLQQALAIHQNRGEAGAADAALVMTDLARQAHKRSRYAEAEQLYRRALAVQRRILGARHPEVALTLNNLALMQIDTGAHVSAEDLLREALSIQRVTLDAGHPDLVDTINNLGLALYYQGQLNDAEAVYREALALFRERLGNEHPKVADLLNNIGSIAQGLMRTDEAARLHSEALAIRRKTYGDHHFAVAESLLQVGRAQLWGGRLDEADATLQQSVRLLVELEGEGHPMVAYPLIELGTVELRRKRWKEAERYFRRALEIRLPTLPADHFEIARTRSRIGESLVGQGSYAEAEPLLLQAWKDIQKTLPPGDKRLTDVKARFDDLYKKWGRKPPPEP